MSDRILSANTPEVEAALRASGNAVLRRVETAMAQGALLLQREAVRNAPKAEGTLHRYIQQGRLAQLVYYVRSIAPNAAWVEEGTGLYGPRRSAPGNKLLPDRAIAALAQWIQRRGITPRTPRVTAEQLPWLIARKIARDGTRAQPYMAPALQSQTPRILQLINAAAAQGLADAGFNQGAA